MHACSDWLCRFARLALGLGVALLAQPVYATDLRSVLTEYALTSWNEKDGLPDSSIYVLEQDADGYMWVGTEEGAYRFDGVRFTPWSTLSRSTVQARAVRALRAAADGSMWIGFGGQGGVDVFKDGLVRSYSTANGLPPATVSMLLEHPAGTFWAGTLLGLYRLQGERWERIGTGQGVPEGPVVTGIVSSKTRLLVGAGRSLLQFDEQTQRFTSIAPLTEDLRALVEDPNGRLTVSDQVAGYRPVDATPRPNGQIERGRGRALARDRRGNLWVGTAGQGLWRVHFDEYGNVLFTERATALTGMLADGVLALTEDREGNIWAGTPEGINRLTPFKVAQVTNIGLVAGVEQAPNGALWIGTGDELLQITVPDARIQPAFRVLAGPRLRALHSDDAGVLWVATDRGLSRWTKGALVPVPAPAMDMPLQIDTITSDGLGGVWVFDAGRKLLRWHDGAFSSIPMPPQVAGKSVEATYTDSSGRVWLAMAGGAVVSGTGNELRAYGPADGLTAGTYQAFYEGRDHVIWLGGVDGLSRFANGRFVTVNRDQGLPVSDLTAIVEDTRGDLWIGSNSGILRIRRPEVERVFADPDYEAKYRLLGRSDGLAGVPAVFSRNRRAIRAENGRLWFVTGRGLTVVDPAALDTDDALSPVRIERMLWDGMWGKRIDGQALPAGTTRLGFEYTVVNLSSPLRQQFRYMLEGFDQDWIDGGARREAVYTNLPPRAYRFRVMSTDSNGEWTEPGETWAFSIKPRFFQTRWFLGSVLGAAALAIGGAWRLHVRSVRQRFALLIGERARLSRELHDTLLQSLVGIALQFDAMANDPQFSFSNTQKQQFVRMRKRIEDYMREARQSVADLRSPRVGTNDLSAAIREAAERATDGHPIEFAFAQRGTPQPISARIEEQLLKIGREAIGNAVRHAHADRITAELEFGQAALSLRISDNGAGFDPSTNGSDGHYGLASMRERAEDVGGHLTIESTAGGGTRVEAMVPLRPVRGKGHAEVTNH